MSILETFAYAKMNGLGNEILVADLRGAEGELTPAQVRALNRDSRLRFDQVMAIHSGERRGAEPFVRIYNADGSESGACGNGSRCVAWFLLRGQTSTQVRFETVAGRMDCRRTGPFAFSVDMGRPRFAWNEIPVRSPVADTDAARLDLGEIAAALGAPSLVSMGNPHAIFWLDDLEKFDLARLGPGLERHPEFPERANISFARIVSRERIVLKVWERGAGLTRACGTAACAAAVAAARLGRCDRLCVVRLPGGELTIEWRADDHVLMTGPCELEHEGKLEGALLASADE